MNLAHLFEIQRKLDQHIIEKKGLEGQDLLPKKILALQVELGELANEWRGFKFWSEDQEPRKIVPIANCHACSGTGLGDTGKFDCQNCDGEGVLYGYPLLEELVDVFHFILSIGLELGHDNVTPTTRRTFDDGVFAFHSMFDYVNEVGIDQDAYDYQCLVECFIGLVEFLGFTWDEVEQAYLSKNKVNHERQESGY